MQDSKARFSNRVDDYVKYRPGYPPAVIDFLQNEYGLTTDKQLADIGAGTGISTGLFLDAGYNVIAVEPNKEMRDMSVCLLGDRKGFRAIEGSAEHIGLQDHCVDAIIAGQAFHWFDVAASKTEFRRILKDKGIVVLVWNERRQNTGFEIEYDALIQKHAREYVKVEHRNIGLEQIRTFFSPGTCRLQVFANSQSFDYPGLEGRLLSSSYMPARQEQGYQSMAADLHSLFDRYNQSGTITIYYDTKVYVGSFEV